MKRNFDVLADKKRLSQKENKNQEVQYFQPLIKSQWLIL